MAFSELTANSQTWAEVLKSQLPPEKSIKSFLSQGEVTSEDSLKSHSSTEAIEFYAKALILERSSQQQQPAENLLPTSPSDLTQMRFAGTDTRKLLYSFALLISRDRSYHQNGIKQHAGNSVAACALHEVPQPVNGPVAKKYTLYAAKNGGFSRKDKKHTENIMKWLNGDDEDLWTTVKDHLQGRIQSYLNSVQKKDTYSSIYQEEQSPVVQDLCNTHCQISTTPRTTEEQGGALSLAYGFVIQNRQAIEAIIDNRNNAYGDLERIWEEVERASRIPLAINCLESFRRDVIRTHSQFKFVPVSMHHKDFSEGVTYKGMVETIRSYALNLSDTEREVLDLNDECLEKLEVGKSRNGSPLELTTIHCEIQLLEYFLVLKRGKHLRNTYDYIGCSKEPCWLCDIVIRMATPFKMAESHGGICWNWALSKSLASLPCMEGALTEADNRMMEIIRQARLVLGSATQFPR
ncbi:hypothetical protein BJ166DRAFT_598645 [Pestalotiopsis sp. NC0098]|nr:hypothetical protein BJ166DRAFT_598645 [Pestalotiopsis sp. NC0098]